MQGKPEDPMPADPNVTQILQRVDSGDAAASEELLPLVYEQLRRCAEVAMRGERAGQTLQATALVHEAYVRLLGERESWQGRAHFFHAAARAMRQLLIERAREKGRIKRGGDGAAGSGPKKVAVNLFDLAAEAPADEILALDEAMTALESRDPDVAAVVRLRFYAGLTVDETALALGVSPRQVDRLWSYARAVLFEHVARTRGEAG